MPPVKEERMQRFQSLGRSSAGPGEIKGLHALSDDVSLLAPLELDREQSDHCATVSQTIPTQSLSSERVEAQDLVLGALSSRSQWHLSI